MKINQTALAKELGISQTAVSLYIHKGILPKNPEKAQMLQDSLHEVHETTPDTTTHLTEHLTDKEPIMLSMQARQLFNLTKNPFVEDVTEVGDVFLTDESRFIRETMYYTAKDGGFLAVVSESGGGKSVLRRDLLARIRRENMARESNITAIMPQTIDKSRLTAANICDAIIDDISNEQPKRSLEAKARQVARLLQHSAVAGNAHTLIIEEAHDISIPVLKYLKRFWELEDGYKKLISIILVGQLELKSKLNLNQNWDAREVIRRIEVAEIQPLVGAELGAYVEHKFTRVGATSPITTDGLAALSERLSMTSGPGASISLSYPLIVNNFVIRALNKAAEIGISTVDQDIINSI